MSMNSREVTFEIHEHIGVLASLSTGWSKELNIVSWNGAAAKYDIRDWSPDHGQMGRGLTLREGEMRQLLRLMRQRRNNSNVQNNREATDTFASGDESHNREAMGSFEASSENSDDEFAMLQQLDEMAADNQLNETTDNI